MEERGVLAYRKQSPVHNSDAMVMPLRLQATLTFTDGRYAEVGLTPGWLATHNVASMHGFSPDFANVPHGWSTLFWSC
jgi:hypothetical protein